MMLKVINNQDLPKKIDIAMLFAMKPDDIDLLIGTNLRRLRENRKLSQEKLGDMIGCAKTKISALENGKEGMGKDIMSRICNALKVEPIEFHFNETTPIATSPLQLRLLLEAKKAERYNLEYIAEENAAYLSQRLDTIKKQKKTGADKGRTARIKTSRG